MYQYKYPHPAVTTDVVIFTLMDKRLKLLLIQRANTPFKGKWALPGGFVEMDEDLESAARRELEEETGVRDAHLVQLHTFGSPKRDPRERVITVVYYALLRSDKISLKAASDAQAVEWFDTKDVPPLAFDHAEIISMACERLLDTLDYSMIINRLMPERFTLSQIQKAYEIISGRTLDKRNFRKQILGMNLIEETGKMKTGQIHRPARLYRLKHSNDHTTHK